MRYRKRFLVLFGCATALFMLGASAAHAFQDVPHYRVGEDGRCILYIDPPHPFPVTFSGTIAAVPFSLVGGYNAIEPHNAQVDITDLMGTGTKHVVVTADGGSFLGVSETVSFDFQCKPAPTTTTTSTTAPPTTSTTSTTRPAVTTTTGPTTTTKAPAPMTPSTRLGLGIVCAPGMEQVGNVCELPHTGGSSGPIGFIGAGVLGAGLAVARRFRKVGR